MEQSSNNAAVVDVQVLLGIEECALNTGQHAQRSDAAVMDAPIKLRREECASSMVQRLNRSDAVVMDARTILSKEECASSMGQRSKDAAVKGAQIKLEREECVGDTEQTSTPMMNLQLLHHALGQNLRKLLRRILISAVQVPSRSKAPYLRR